MYHFDQILNFNLINANYEPFLKYDINATVKSSKTEIAFRIIYL